MPANYLTKDVAGRKQINIIDIMHVPEMEHSGIWSCYESVI